MSRDKISVAMIAKNLEINGISSVIINYCEHLDLKRINITIIVGNGIAKSYQQICDNYGIKIIQLPDRKKHLFSYIKGLNNCFKKNIYDIVHVHGNQAAIALELIIGAFNGIKIRIAHSHNTTCAHKCINFFLKPLFRVSYTNGFACGTAAGKWMFGRRKFDIIYNGFDVNQFQYDEEMRKEQRKLLQIEDKFVIGHIGRINDQKNQTFLLDVFTRIAKENEKAMLLLVGIGPNMEHIKELVKKHKYKNRIILYGETNHPDQLYMAMDVFAFPSKYEGLPVTLLEAQISGLPCVISDVITTEVIFNNNIVRLPLDCDKEEWARNILYFYNNKLDRFCVNKQVRETYDINNCAMGLQRKYFDLVGKNEN